MSGIKRYLSDNAYKAAEHSESPSESNPFVTLHKAIAMRSDWNENDTTQYDYILNRTHYIDYIPTDYEGEEETFVEDRGYAHGSIYGYSSGHSLYPEGFTEALAEGRPFKFVIGDTTYEGIGHRPGSGSMFYAGNRHIYNNVFPDTGESWCVYSGMLGMAPFEFYIDSSYIGTTQNIVPTTYSEVVHQLPTKFINSDLATKENVANKKTSLDENSDTYYPTQKAVKTAVDAKVGGPASSVNNTVPVFDGITSKLLKGSSIIVDGDNMKPQLVTFKTPTELTGTNAMDFNLNQNWIVYLSGATTTITMTPITTSPVFTANIEVVQDATGGRDLVLVDADGKAIINTQEFDFKTGGANQRCFITIKYWVTGYRFLVDKYI